MVDFSEIQHEQAKPGIGIRDLNRTYSARPADIKRQWFVVDAKGQPLGRLASRVATLLLGKHKESYTAHIDTGDFVVVINASSVKLTGRKLDQKYYHRHSGYIGGLKSFTARDKLRREPTFLVQKAIYGMLPKTKLGRQMIKKLKVYAGPEHPHSAQQPTPLVVVQ